MDKLNLSQVQKCDQVWNDMKSSKNGRMCTQCSKEIHDFRKKSLKEIAQIHIESNEAVCGLYNEHHLQFNSNPPPSVSKRNSLSAYALGVTSLLSLQSFLAEAQIDGTKTELPMGKEDTRIVSESKLTKTDSLKQQTLIKGTVKFPNSVTDKLEPVPYANVILKTDGVYRKGVVTDFDGCYSLDITEFLNEDEDSVTIEIQLIGYDRTKRKVPLKEPSQQDFILSDKNARMVTFGVVVRAPWYKRLWSKIKSPFTSNNE